MEAHEALARRLRLRDLHMLRAVAEAGSMARAAEALSLSQSAISKAVAEMERTLGVPLLERTARGVEATGFGQVLLRRGVAVLDELRQGFEELRFLADPTLGEVRVGATEPMTVVVSAVIDRLSAAHRRMRFHVAVAHTVELLDRVRARDLDLAICRVLSEELDPELRVEALFHDPLVVLADARHPLAKARWIELGGLLGEPWALPPYDGFLGAFVSQAFRVRGLEPPRATVETRSVHAWVAMLRTGRFLGMGPSAMLRFPAHYPSLAALPLEFPETRRPVALVTLAHRTAAPAARVFAEYARSVGEEVGSGK